MSWRVARVEERRMFWSESKLELTAEHKQTLCALTVDENGPGTILRDFETLLSFSRGRSLPVSKTHHLLPIKILPELNARLAHPIQLGLKRPKLKSYPHIRGLYLLLRATGLASIGGTPSKPVLTIDETLYEAWLHMNPAERYFTLLEAWLLRGRPEIVGERGSSFSFASRVGRDCAELIRRTPPEGLLIAGNNRVGMYVRYSPGPMGIALLELFGLLAIEHGPPEQGKGWQIERVYRTPIGEAVFALLYTEILSDIDRIIEFEESPPESFGVLQPIFQPYVQAWQSNLELPQWAFRDGLHVLKVSLWRGLWRQIALPAGSTLDALAHAILDAYKFDHDHLYMFSYRNRFGVLERVQHSHMDEGPWTDEVRIGDVPLQVGQTMEYLFDFGDSWRFDITLERIDPPGASVEKPILLDGRGEAPEQYPRWDEEE